MLIIILWALIATSLSVYIYYQYRKTYQTMNHIVDDILNGNRITNVNLKEGELSALSDRMMRVGEKLTLEIGKAEEEKEQVKQLISNLSHQLKTPLANICMYEEMLEDETLPNDVRKDFLEKLRRQSEKTDWILQSLFKMTKLEQNVIELNPESAGIKKIIQDAVSSVYLKAARKNITIDMEEITDDSLWQDTKWTLEVFENILENAIKYTEPNGRIHIYIERLEMYTSINIEDTGRGILPGEETKIFERFYRGKGTENIEGSGIGLYLSKLILEKEKGYMTVVSELNKGSCFSVFLQNCKN